MEKPDSTFPVAWLRWLSSVGWVCTIYLGVWGACLHLYSHVPEINPERQAVVAYLLGAGGDGLPDIGFLNFAEARHLLDVRRLFAGVEHLFYWILPCSVLLLVLQQRFAKGGVLLRIGYLGLASILLPGLLMLLGGFVPLFILLHTLLFPAGTWVFPDDSILIQLFPLDYFFHFGLVYAGGLVLIFGGLLVWGKFNKEIAHAYRDSQGNQE